MTFSPKALTLASLLAFAPIAAPAASQTSSLAEDAHITKMLVAAQVGDILRKTCPKVRARMFVVLSEMLALQRYAQDLGFDDAAIDAFLDDKAQKKRIRSLADAYLADAGWQSGDAALSCAVARAEVAAGTVAGSLMRVVN